MCTHVQCCHMAQQGQIRENAASKALNFECKAQATSGRLTVTSRLTVKCILSTAVAYPCKSILSV